LLYKFIYINLAIHSAVCFLVLLIKEYTYLLTFRYLEVEIKIKKCDLFSYI